MKKRLLTTMMLSAAVVLGGAIGLHDPVTAQAASADEEQEEMYRLYNPNSGEHFYTASVAERDYLGSIGWNKEGTAWTSATDKTQGNTAAVYRLYNPNTGDHHYTTNAGERDELKKVGWKYEQIGWYSANSNGAPVYRLYNPNATGAGSHHYTTSEAEKNYLVSIGWNDEGIGWYAIGKYQNRMEILSEDIVVGEYNSTYDYTSVYTVVTMKNLSDLDLMQSEIILTAYDSNGGVLDEDSHYMTDLKAQDTSTFVKQYYVNGAPASFKIEYNTSNIFYGDIWKYHAFAQNEVYVTNASGFEEDGWGFIATGDIVNESDIQVEAATLPKVSVVARDETGKVVGAGTTFLDATSSPAAHSTASFYHVMMGAGLEKGVTYEAYVHAYYY